MQVGRKPAWPTFRLELAAEQLEELARCSEAEPEAYMRERCDAILQVAQGKGLRWVARHGLRRPQGDLTIKKLISVYQAEGLVGLLLLTMTRASTITAS